MKKLFLLLMIIAVFWGCKKTPPVIEPEINYYDMYSEAVVFKDSLFIDQCSLGYYEEVSEDIYEYFNPSFNPNNPYQICYMRHKINSLERWELWSFDFITGKTIRLHPDIGSQIEWGGSNWILFSGINNKLYKIKPDGDSLTQLTFSGIASDAHWNPSGDKIIYSHEGGGGNFCYIIDADGNRLESVNYIGTFCWASESEIIVNGSEGIYSYNLQTKTRSLIDQIFPPPPGNQGIIRRMRAMNEDIYWLVIKRLLKSSPNSERDTVFNSEGSMSFHYGFDINPKAIILERKEIIKKISFCKIAFTRRLYLLDTDGKNPRWLKIPEYQ